MMKNLLNNFNIALYIKAIFIVVLSSLAFQSYACTHTIRLRDTYGDGWNGGTVTVRVNGAIVLNNITLAAGPGPTNLTFNANVGDAVWVGLTTPGLYPNEMRVEVLDAGSNVIIANHQPTPAGNAGLGACPAPPANMSITGITLTQISDDVSNCGSPEAIIRIQINTTGTLNPINFTQFITNFTGTFINSNRLMQ